MNYQNKPSLKGRIISDSTPSHTKQDRAVNKACNSDCYDSITQKNPNPILRLAATGEVLYANDKGLQMLESLSSDERSLQAYRLGVLAQKALGHKKNLKFQYHLNNADYKIEVCPVPETTFANLYFSEISESVKIKNYFEVQAAFAEALIYAESVDEVVWSIVKQAIARLGYEDCVVYMLLEDGNTLVQRAAHGPKNPRDSQLENPIHLKLGEGIAGSVAMSKQAEIVNDVSKDDRYVVDDEQRLSEIAVPIVDGDTLIGVIDSEHRHRNFYTREDLSILTAIASMAATKIQRIKSTESIKTAQEKNKSLIENAFGGIYTLRGTRFEMVNRVFKEITGYAEQELTAQNFDIKTLIVHVDKEGQVAMNERTEGDRTRKSYKIDIKTKHNERKRLAINTVILEDEKGPYTLGIAYDITPMLESERTLQSVNKELSSRNEELRQFAHLASHNLRSPLSNMIGLLDIFEKENLSEHNATVVEALSKAAENFNSSLTEMHQVLKMKAVSDNNFGQINMDEALNKACALLSTEIKASGIEIISSFDPLMISYVSYHIDNFFFNLISNAIKYSDANRRPYLRITSKTLTGGVQLVFQDNGIGIDLQRHKNEIFGMYKSFHNYPDSRGIGLYLVHSQLQSLGGEITVESTVGQGTTFTLMLKTAGN